MIQSGRSIFAATVGIALAIGLVAFAQRCTAYGQFPKKSPPLSQLEKDMARFRALEPGERLKFVEKLAGVKMPFTAAKRGDLTVTVVERGSIEPATFFDLTCKVKAKSKENRAATTIKWLIEDGTRVTKGDRLALLDDAAIRDQLQVAEVAVKQAEAALAKAVENALLVKKDNAIEVRLAEIDVKLAEAELKNPPAGSTKEVLELRVEQAKLKHDRAKSNAKAQLVKAEAETRAKTAARDLEVQRHRSIESELKHCELIAPADGFAYYVPVPSRFGGGATPIAKGEPVREGQKLIRVVDLKEFVLTTRIPEALISTLRTDQAAEVRVDAFPDKVLRGTVKQISTVASRADWSASNIKLYPITIAIKEPPATLKPDMSATVHIATGERKAVLQVPRTAVITSGKEQFCFIKVGDELQERKVVTGAGNANSVEIKAGLKEDDRILADPRALLVRP